MKKAATAALGMIITMSILAGCGENHTEETSSEQVQVQEKESEETAAVSTEPEVTESEDIETGTEEENQKETSRELLLQEERTMIDTSVPIAGGVHIAVVSKATEGEFWELIRQGMDDAVESVNEAFGFEKEEEITMNFEGAESELDIETQVNTIDVVIAENPDVLCVSVGDMDSCQAQLEAARENGIPVVVFDSNVSESDLITAFRATDNVEVGRLAAEKLAEGLGGEGALVVFSAPEMTESAKNRLEGFELELKNYPEMEIVEVVYIDQVDDMKSAMQSTIVEHPELKGVFCSNADVAEMYLSLEETLESRAILMVGVDATSVQQEAVREGKELGVISQNPHMMGFETIWTALLTTVPDEAEMEITKNKFMKPVWLDVENIDDPEYGKYLY